MLKLCINYGMSALELDGKLMCWFLWNIGPAENSFRLTGCWSFAMHWTYSLIYYRRRLRIPFPAMYCRGVRSEPRRDAYKEACMGPGVRAGSHVVADQEGYHWRTPAIRLLVERAYGLSFVGLVVCSWAPEIPYPPTRTASLEHGSHCQELKYSLSTWIIISLY